jgi:hypothetical protein
VPGFVLRLLSDEISGSVGEPPVGAVDQFERDAGSRRQPPAGQPLRVRLIDGQVDGAQRGRAQAPGVAQRGDGSQVVPVDE